MKPIILAFIASTLAITLNAQSVSKKFRGKQYNPETSINHQSSVKQLAEKVKWFTLPRSSQNLINTSQMQKLDSVEYSYPQDENGFLISEKDIYEYNTLGLNTFSYFYDLNETSENMELQDKTEFTYLNGYLDEAIGYILNGETGEMEKSGKTEFEYTANGLTDKMLFSEWESELEIWATFMKVQYIYNENEMVSSTVISFIWDTEDIVFAKNDYFYGDGGELIKIEDYADIFEEGDMILTSQTEFNYENGLLTLEIYSELDENSEMQYFDRLKYTYTPEKTISSEIDEYFDIIGKVWLPIFKTDYSYSSTLTYEYTKLPAEFYLEQGIDKFFINGIPIKIDFYDFYEGEWFYNSHGEVYYSELETKASESAQDNLVVFPNPASDVIYIGSNNVSAGICNLFDGSGRIVLSQNVRTDGSIDISSVQAGYYLLQVTVNNNVLTIKIIKQ